MRRTPLQGPSRGPRHRLRIALLLAGVAATVGSIAVVGLQAAPGGDVIGAKRGQVRELEAEIQGIDAQATTAADASAAAVRRRDDLLARIADTARGLRETRRAHDIAVERLSARLVGLYRQEPPSLIEVLLVSGGLTAAFETQRALEAVGDSDRELVDQLAATRDRLARQRAALLADRSAVEASVVQSSQRLGELRRLIGARRAALDQAQTALDGLVAADVGRRERAAADRSRRAAAAAAARDLLQRAEGAAPAVEAPTALVTPAAAAPTGGASATLERIARCESGGNPAAVSPSGQYRGKYQFDIGTWQALGGSGDPAAASEGEQDRIAGILYARSGPAPWPVCGYQ